MIMKIRMSDRDRRKREAMRLAFSLQKGLEHHHESVVRATSFYCIHGGHNLHHKESRNSGKIQNLSFSFMASWLPNKETRNPGELN